MVILMSLVYRFIWLLVLSIVVACVDPEDLTLRGTVDVIVVDGVITNLAEPQVIRLNYSKADPVTGRFGSPPVMKATVQVIVDSLQIIFAHETVDGTYQLPSDFKGQVGHAYQLRFTLVDGTSYMSSQQVMSAVPPINGVTLRFSTTSLPNTGQLEGFRAGYNVLLTVQDPIDQPNYYRWDWKLWEKQDWCQSCNQGYYITNQLKQVSSYPNILIYQTQPELAESCFAAPSPVLFGGSFDRIPNSFVNSYICRTECWDIIYDNNINVFSDQNSNGGLITNRNVGQIPYYTQNPALVAVSQSSLTADAYRYFILLQQQTQNTGGLADGPPTVLAGNVRNVKNIQEKVIGYFTAGAVSVQRSWIDKKGTTGIAYGSVYYDIDRKLTLPVPGDKQLFFAFNRELPRAESYFNFTILGGSSRPPTAVCVPTASRTPFKPDGWRD